MLVENCYFDQVYDAAVTVQYPIRGEMTRDSVIDNVRWVNNLFQRCNYPFELWLYSPEDTNGFYAAQRNIDISGNIAINTGYGWSHQRFDPAYQFYYGGGKRSAIMPVTNCAIHDNTFINGKRNIISAAHVGGDKIKFYDNTIYHNGIIGALPENLEGDYEKLKGYPMDDETIELLEGSGYFGKNTWCKIADTENENPYIVKLD